MIELNSKQRKFLEKEAHDLSPLVIIGGAGLTDGVIDMVDNSLFHHELIKVKFNEYKDEKIDLTNEICQKTNATLVRVIGNVAILYRPAEEVEKRRYPQVVSVFTFLGFLFSQTPFLIFILELILRKVLFFLFIKTNLKFQFFYNNFFLFCKNLFKIKKVEVCISKPQPLWQFFIKDCILKSLQSFMSKITYF